MLAQLLNLTRPLVLFDLETTTSKKETARIVQYAHMVFRPDGSISEYHTLVDPLVEIPKASTEVHGISDLIIKFGCAKCGKTEGDHYYENDHPWSLIPTMQQLGPRLHRGLQGCDLAGYNVGFDIEVLDLNLNRECDLRLDVDGMCVIDAHRLWQVLEPRTLSDAIKWFCGEEPKDAHDALADVRMTAKVLRNQLERKHDLPLTVPELHHRLYPDRIDFAGKFKFNRAGEPCFGFGKHDGEPMFLHIDYLRWMKRQGNWSSHVTRIVDDALRGKFPERQHEVSKMRELDGGV